MSTQKITSKVYRTSPNFKTYGAQIIVNGAEITIDFRGGHSSPYQKGGAFSTADPDIQKAIESRKDFGTFITLEYEETREVESDVKATEPQAEAPDIPVVDEFTEKETRDTEDVPPTGEPTDEAPLDGETVVMDVNTAQEAKAWLMKNKGVTARELPNKKAILEYAENNGVKFPLLETN